jgi:hypothetical protein
MTFKHDNLPIIIKNFCKIIFCRHISNLFNIEVINTSDGATVRIKDPVPIETLREKVYAAGCSIILKAEGEKPNGT